MDEENATDKDISERAQKESVEETTSFSIFEEDVEDLIITSTDAKKPSKPRTNSKVKGLDNTSPPLFQTEIVSDSDSSSLDGEIPFSSYFSEQGYVDNPQSKSLDSKDQTENKFVSSQDDELFFINNQNEKSSSLLSSQIDETTNTKEDFSKSKPSMSKNNLHSELNSTTESQLKSYQVKKAIITGFVIAGMVLGALKLGSLASLALGMVVVLVAISEAYVAFRRAGYKPAALLGIVATAILMISGYYQGTSNLALIITLMIVFSFIWYLSGVLSSRPSLNIAITLLPFLWIGFLGSFIAFILSPTFSPNNYGVSFLLAAILNTAFYDIGGLFAGKRFGKHRLASNISPNKTWEGLLGGSVAVLLVSALIISNIHPWNLTSALILALAVIVVEPLGDLCESLVKRDFAIKDMGGWLPGHGGMLDRIDGLLFVLPTTYYLVILLHLR